MTDFPSIILAEFPIDGQVIFIIVALIATAIKAVFDKIQASKNPPQDFQGEDYSEDAYAAYREEIRARQTQLQEPAPPPLPVNEPPPLPVQSPPPRPVRTPASPPPNLGRSSLPTVRKPVLSTAEKAALRRVSESGTLSRRQRRSASTGPIKGVRSLLATPQAARQAIILREILGPPGGREVDSGLPR